MLATLHYLDTRGFTIVVVSATARLLLEPVLGLLPIGEILAMEFLCDNKGDFSGKTPEPSPAGSGKALVIQEKYGDSLEFAAGNSQLDADFMLLARQKAWAYEPDATLKALASANSWFLTP